MKDFNYAEYVEWRAKAEKLNEFHNQLAHADIVIA